MPTNLKRNLTLPREKEVRENEVKNIVPVELGLKNELIEKLLTEITDLRLIYNEVLEELDTLKNMSKEMEETKADLSEMKNALKIMEGKIEISTKSLIESCEEKFELKKKEKEVLFQTDRKAVLEENVSKNGGNGEIKNKTTLASRGLIITKRR